MKDLMTLVFLTFSVA